MGSHWILPFCTINKMFSIGLMMTVYGRNMKTQCNLLHTLYYYIDVVVHWRYIIYCTNMDFVLYSVTGTGWSRESEQVNNIKILSSVLVFKCLLNTSTLNDIYYPYQPMHNIYINSQFLYRKYFYSRWHWPRGLRCGSAAARLLGLRVRFAPVKWMSLFCECCVLSGRGLCVGLITCPEEFFRLWFVWVWSWILDS